MTWPKAEKSTRNSVNALSRLRAFDVKWTSEKLNEKKINKVKYHHYWLENYAFYGRKKNRLFETNWEAKWHVFSHISFFFSLSLTLVRSLVNFIVWANWRMWVTKKVNKLACIQWNRFGTLFDRSDSVMLMFKRNRKMESEREKKQKISL